MSQPNHDKIDLFNDELHKSDVIEDGLREKYPELEKKLRRAWLLGSNNFSQKLTDWVKANKGWTLIIAAALCGITYLAFR